MVPQKELVCGWWDLAVFPPPGDGSPESQPQDLSGIPNHPLLTLGELCKVQVLQHWKHELISWWDQVCGDITPGAAVTSPALMEALVGSDFPVTHCPAHQITLKGFEKCWICFSSVLINTWRWSLLRYALSLFCSPGCLWPSLGWDHREYL